MKNAYKVTYEICNRDIGSKDYGYAVVKTKKFPTLNKAVEYSRYVANTEFVISKPIIEGV